VGDHERWAGPHREITSDPAEATWLTCRPEWNTSVPHAARIYDHLLGGKDNFEADRAAAGRR
jgi:hypothetical protein